MIPLIINETPETPKVYFDKDKNIFEISGLAIPENAIDYCKPIINWIEKYSSDPNPISYFHFKLEYFNTAFSTQIINILMLLEKLNAKKTVEIYWHYKDIDEDMFDLGKKYDDIISVKFHFIPYA